MKTIIGWLPHNWNHPEEGWKNDYAALSNITEGKFEDDDVKVKIIIEEIVE